MRDEVEVVVVGGGQAGLATAFYLRRAGLRPGEDFVVLDAGSVAGGSWPNMWPGLRLFSPAGFSSLPGWLMPPWNDEVQGYPPRDHVVDYLRRYEQRYRLEVQRPVRVTSVSRGVQDDGWLRVTTPHGELRSRTVVSPTGTWDRPFWPSYPGMRLFGGRQLHTVDYDRPEEFIGQRVIIVGGGNSAAQILAEVSAVTQTLWVTAREPRFLPDEVDGRALFAAARERILALEQGRDHPGVRGLGDIVMIASVRAARDRGALRARPMFDRLTHEGVAWHDGTTARADVIIWCTGFRAALSHLAPLRLREKDGTIRVDGPQSVDVPGLFLVGYGDWVGPASATLAGVGPFARSTAEMIMQRRRNR